MFDSDAPARKVEGEPAGLPYSGRRVWRIEFQAMQVSKLARAGDASRKSWHTSEQRVQAKRLKLAHARCADLAEESCEYAMSDTQDGRGLSQKASRAHGLRRKQTPPSVKRTARRQTQARNKSMHAMTCHKRCQGRAARKKRQLSKRQQTDRSVRPTRVQADTRRHAGQQDTNQWGCHVCSQESLKWLCS